VLLGFHPWGGQTAVELITWCPIEWLSASDWTLLKGELELGGFMIRRESNNGVPSGPAFSDEELGASWPALYEFLRETCYEGDPTQPRVTPTLLIFGLDGGLRGCLRDRDQSRCCWVSAPTLGDLLGILDRELGDGTAVWRADRLSGATEATRLNGKKKG
jgi:hypothetical protein